jgi:hypothetical protein
MAMRRAKPQSSLDRITRAVVVVSIIALVLILSLAINSGTGHGFHPIVLALPVFFVLLILATTIGDWLQPEDSFLAPQPHLFASHTRAPPA